MLQQRCALPAAADKNCVYPYHKALVQLCTRARVVVAAADVDMCCPCSVPHTAPLGPLIMHSLFTWHTSRHNTRALPHTHASPLLLLPFHTHPTHHPPAVCPRPLPTASIAQPYPAPCLPLPFPQPATPGISLPFPSCKLHLCQLK